MESDIKVISRNSKSLSGTEFRQGFAVFMKCTPTGKKKLFRRPAIYSMEQRFFSGVAAGQSEYYCQNCAYTHGQGVVEILQN